MEFAFKFSMKTLDESNSKTPGMRRVKTLTYKSQFEGTPHFVALNSFSGRFVKETGELVDRPLAAFEVSVWIKNIFRKAHQRLSLFHLGAYGYLF